jgi:hypothetical protein
MGKVAFVAGATGAAATRRLAANSPTCLLTYWMPVDSNLRKAPRDNAA